MTHAPPTTAPGHQNQMVCAHAADRAGLSATAAEPDTLTILIIDDHRAFADLLSAALNTVPGIRCVGTVATAAEGIAMAAELQPDIVAIDIRLPCGDDGPAVTRRIKEVAPDAVAVITSAYRDPEWVSRAAQAGASAFLPKTGSLSDMLDVLRRIRPGS